MGWPFEDWDETLREELMNTIASEPKINLALVQAGYDAELDYLTARDADRSYALKKADALEALVALDAYGTTADSGRLDACIDYVYDLDHGREA